MSKRFSVQEKENVTFNRVPSTSYKIFESTEEQGREVTVLVHNGICNGFDATDEACIKDYLHNDGGLK